LSGFLEALARKALQPPSLRPRPASRFEDAGSAGPAMEAAPIERTAPTDAAAEVVHSRPEAVRTMACDQPTLRAPAARDEPAHPLPRVPEIAIAQTPTRRAIEPIALDPPTRAPLPISDASPTLHATPWPPRPETLPDTRVEPRGVPPTVAPTTRVESVVRESHRSTEIERRLIERLTVPADAGQAAHGPAGSTVSTPAPPAPRPPAPTPRVEIHIGRIEVHAATPATPPRLESTPDAPRRVPAQSLDAYLGERSANDRTARRGVS
jgi:hypothetical protein